MNQHATGPLAVDNRKDLILLLLYAPGATGELNEGVDGITRLQKLLFLADKEFGLSRLVDRYYRFNAYDFGPFDQEVYADIEALQGYSLVIGGEAKPLHQAEVVEADFAKDYTLKGELELTEGPAEEGARFGLTERGKEIAERLQSSLSDAVWGELVTLKSNFNSKPLSELIRYVYRKYPESAQFSKLSYDS